jgi:hypothetical protein
VTKVPDHGLYLVWLYVEAVRRRWSLSVAAAKPALRIGTHAAGIPTLRPWRLCFAYVAGFSRNSAADQDVWSIAKTPMPQSISSITLMRAA